jgi:hypothetical protein
MLTIFNGDQNPMKFKILVIDKTKFSWENYGDQQHPSINVMEFC